MNFVQNFVSDCKKILDLLDLTEIEKLVLQLAKIRNEQGRLFILGNGGSAGHASHAVNDFRKLCDFEAYSPMDNVSELTARINDEGWENSTADWLRASRFNSKDCLLIFSVGGGNKEKNVSTNIVKAIDLVLEKRGSVFGIVGKDGGYTKLKSVACVVVPTVNQAHVTPHAEGFCAIVWHLLVTHPALKKNPTKW